MSRTRTRDEETRSPLGPSEAKTLDLYHKGYLTAEEIAKERGLTASTIRNHIASLKRKGYLNIVPGQPGQKSEVVGCMPSAVTKRFRLHGEEYNVQVLNGSSTFDRARRRGTDLFLDGHRVRIYSRSLEIYSGRDFWGLTPRDCEAESSRYWFRFLAMLEHRLNVLLVKPGTHNIRRVKHHVAEVGNELAVQANRDKERIRVSKDGREWLLADASKGFQELETVDPQSAALDMQDVVMPFFNDLRDRSDAVRLPSQVAAELDQLRSLVFEIGSAVKLLVPSPPESLNTDSSLMDYYG